MIFTILKREFLNIEAIRQGVNTGARSPRKYKEVFRMSR
jgi:hypothetical protein